MAPVWALLPRVSENARNNASTPMRSATFLLMLSSRFVCPPWCSPCLISCSTSCWTAWTPCVIVFLHHGFLLAPKTSRSSRRHAQVGSEASSSRVLAAVSVNDTGPGIPADECERVFEKFRQVDSSNARAKGGTGLGLAIAREIVEMHGGRIWVE